MVRKNTVSELIKPETLVLLAPETTVGDAARKMLDRQVGLVVVVEGEIAVGIVTERDINFRVVAHSLNAEKTTLAEIMTANPVLMPPETGLAEALRLVVTRYFRFAVVGSAGRVVGVVPVSLIFAEIARAMDDDITDIDRFIKGEVLSPRH